MRQDSRKFLMMVVRPSVIGNSGAFGRCLHNPDTLFFPSGKLSACFAYVVPKATAKGDFTQYRVVTLIGVET